MRGVFLNRPVAGRAGSGNEPMGEVGSGDSIMQFAEADLHLVDKIMQAFSIIGN